MTTKYLVDANGEPEIFTHDCYEMRKGKPMSYEEIESFVAESIASAYAKRNVDYVWNHNRKNSSSPHFTLRMRNGDVNIIVNIGHPRITDFTEMLYKFDEYGHVPRLYVADVYCLDTDGGEAICGGSFAIKYTPVSLLMCEKESAPPQRLSDQDLSKLLARAWNELDISIIEPYLSKDLFYSSEWVFDLLPSRYEYLQYIRGKFNAIRNGGNPVTASPLLYSRVGLTGVLLNQEDTETFLSIKTRDGLISEIEMRDPKCLYEDIDLKPVVIDSNNSEPADEDENASDLYEGHGDHWEAIMPIDKYINILGSLIQDGKLVLKANTDVKIEDYEGSTDVMALCYGDKHFVNAALIVHNPIKNTNDFITSYPIFFDGYPYQMKITKVVEWHNKLEAIVWGEIDGFNVAFFATDYVQYKSIYQPGYNLKINLSALAMKVEKSDKGFEFTGQQAIDFLAKMGQNPNFMPNGEVEPVRFNTENLVSFLQIREKCPEDAEFQSPVLRIDHLDVLGIPFTQVEILIHRRDVDEKQIKIPLFFRNDMLPDVQVSDPIQGYIWLMGEVI